METSRLTLLVPSKSDPERDAVAEEFTRQGGAVLRLDRFWEPPLVDSRFVRVYGPDTFAWVLQQKLNLELVSPDDRLIGRVPSRFLGRQSGLLPLRDVLTAGFPTFVKPVVPKQFRGKVYPDAEQLRVECRGLGDHTEVFRSEVVAFVAEARAFLCTGRILDLQVYEGATKLDGLANFVSDLAATIELPSAVVVDVGIDAHGRPMLIEFNAAWGAGLNGCSPALVLPAILRASRPRA